MGDSDTRATTADVREVVVRFNGSAAGDGLDVVEGTVLAPGVEAQPFVGWLQLLSLLEQLAARF